MYIVKYNSNGKPKYHKHKTIEAAQEEVELLHKDGIKAQIIEQLSLFNDRYTNHMVPIGTDRPLSAKDLGHSKRLNGQEVTVKHLSSDKTLSGEYWYIAGGMFEMLLDKAQSTFPGKHQLNARLWKVIERKAHTNDAVQR